MRAKKIAVQRIARLTLAFAIGAVLCAAAMAASNGADSSAADTLAAARSAQPAARPPLHLTLPLLTFAQNSSIPLTLPEMAEPAVSPINPGTLPGSTAAIGGSSSGTNPLTGLPCNGSGSLSVSGAGGLPGTATPPPGLANETLDQIPVGAPPTTSIYGSQSNLGPC